MQDTSKQTFNKNILSTYNRYIEKFPEEKERQSEFIQHLTNPDLDLRLRSTIPEGHLCASAILILPEEKILMLEHKALGIWVVPGGHYDLTDENLIATAIRETEEETGLSGIHVHPWHIESGTPIDIDTHPIPLSEKKNEGAHQHFDFRYVLVLDNPEEALNKLQLDTNEVLNFDTISIAKVDATSSIAPAVAKLRKFNIV